MLAEAVARNLLQFCEASHRTTHFIGALYIQRRPGSFHSISQRVFPSRVRGDRSRFKVLLDLIKSLLHSLITPPLVMHCVAPVIIVLCVSPQPISVVQDTTASEDLRGRKRVHTSSS
jgi:hypothetical protein